MENNQSQQYNPKGSPKPSSINLEGQPMWVWFVVYLLIGGFFSGIATFYAQAQHGYAYIAIPAQNYRSTSALDNSQQATSSQTLTTKSFIIKNMHVEILQEGNGLGAKVGDTVTVNYTGTLEDGTKFDSSLNPGRSPFQFTLGQNRVIQGWELGVIGMKVGEKRRLTIPPELGYGPQGYPPVIPQNATLTFVIDLLKIN
jgi:FKBP-type peptidyl-prolyl cis-trans isomerase